MKRLNLLFCMGIKRLCAKLRMIKSPLEQAKIGHACDIASNAFARIAEAGSREGTPLSEVFRRFQILCLECGADAVPYLAGGAGPDGYLDVISPATDKPLSSSGDVLMLDTGLILGRLLLRFRSQLRYRCNIDDGNAICSSAI